MSCTIISTELVVPVVTFRLSCHTPTTYSVYRLSGWFAIASPVHKSRSPKLLKADVTGEIHPLPRPRRLPPSILFLTYFCLLSLVFRSDQVVFGRNSLKSSLCFVTLILVLFISVELGYQFNAFRSFSFQFSVRVPSHFVFILEVS